jgi:hypothetical protein
MAFIPGHGAQAYALMGGPAGRKKIKSSNKLNERVTYAILSDLFSR